MTILKTNKQRSYCVTLLRKAKKQYYDSLEEKHVTDNKTFWKTVTSKFLLIKILILREGLI